MSRFKFRTIRARLLFGFVLMALLSAVSISAGSAVVGYFNGRSQATERLESVAALKEVQVAVWTDSLHNELLVASTDQYAPKRASIVLDLAGDDQYLDYYSKAVRNRLRRLVEPSPQIQEIFLLDLNGQVVLSTDIEQEGKQCHEQPFFLKGLSGPAVQLPFDPDTSAAGVTSCGTGSPSQDRMLAYAAIPVIGQGGETLGVIAGRATIGPLKAILADRTGLGKTGKVYLVDAHSGSLLTDGSQPVGESPTGGQRSAVINSQGVYSVIENLAHSSGVYRDYRDVPVFGVYRWLPDMELVLSAEQDQSEALGAISTALSLNLGIVAIVVALAVAASFFITRSITGPLVSLVDTATQIAGGDLERAAPVKRDDEVGTLAVTFNSMTAQLRDLINNLEQRVGERTRELQAANVALEQRAVQLETSAQVGREVTSILNIDDLLNQVVELICDAFGYYHVHVFLVDQDSGHLIPRASTGELGHLPPVLTLGPDSLNGTAAQSGEAVLENDVTQSARFLAHEQMSKTQSELVIPLNVGDELIGTLDVHSAELNAFSPEDVLVIQSLGDQIAIAIENARLYERSRELAVVEERNRLARDLHDSVIQALYSLSLLAEGWRRLIRAGNPAPVEDYLDRVGEISHQALKEMRLLVHELRPSALQQEGLLGALHQRLGAVESRTGVETRLLADDLYQLPPPVEEGLFRIAQEALNNALKHSGATQVTVRIHAANEHIVLEVADNGQGFAADSPDIRGGLGLTSMRERAKQLGGSLTISSQWSAGTMVKAVVPVDGARPQPLASAGQHGKETDQ